MKKINIVIGLVGVVLIFGLYATFAIIKRGESSQLAKIGIQPNGVNYEKIRIGWQIPWATQGQLVQILKHTGILGENKLEADFKGFSYGGPLNEAALAKEIDVVLTADQPAATLIAKNPDWVIIGRLMYNRVSLYVPPNSPINKVADLKGKTVAMPFGAAAQRMTLKAEKDAGLDPNKDVNNINLGIYEQSDLVRDTKAIKWGSIDALAGFDPTPAIFEEKGLTRNLQVSNVVSLIVVSREYIQRYPEAPANLLKSFIEAYDYYRNNIGQSDSWFIEEAKLDITPDVLKLSASPEPNLKVTDKKDIRLGFTDEDYQIMQEAADFIYGQDLVKTKVDMRASTDMSYLEQVLR